MSIVRVIMTGSILGQKMQNVLHFQNPDGALTNLQISEELKPNWITVLRNVQNNQLQWTEISVQRVDSPGFAADVYTVTAAPGSLSGSAALTFACPVVSIRTGVAGRAGHGRFYIFGLHGDSVSNGAFQSGAFAAYQTYVGNLKNRYKSGGTGPIVLGVCPRNNPVDFKPMTDLIVRPIFGVQRRRNLGVGG